MFVIFISECSKKALEKTREVLDQFATRKGRRTWFTNINQEGLEKIRVLLTENASKNTCIMCYSHFASTVKLIFTVGSTRKISSYNAIPTNTTNKIMDFNSNTNFFIYQAISLLARLSALFHDFGKASPLFQEKLLKSESKDIIRHEFLSCLFIYKIAKNCNSDSEFIASLRIVDESKNIVFTKEDLTSSIVIGSLKSKLAQSLCYLILSHHVLPTPVKWMGFNDNDRNDIFKSFLCKSGFDYINSKYALNRTAKIDEPLILKDHLYKSVKFRLSLNNCLDKIEKFYWSIYKYFGLEQIYILHLSRLSLMIADHFYSSDNAQNYYHDKNYEAIANTSGYKVIKQYLDDHVCTVAKYAYFFAKSLSNLRKDLPTINNARQLRKLSKGKYCWQNNAYEQCLRYCKQTDSTGFFGINLASTGSGKTYANAKIMYALSNEKDLRFNYAISLRTLTLQTGRALKDKLAVPNDITVKIGSKTLLDLNNYLNDFKDEKVCSFTGSSSFNDEDSLSTTDSSFSTNNYLFKTTKKFLSKNYNAFLSPILVSTLDYINEASEGYIGGRNFFGFLRLLSADLVLDEIDEINCEEQFAVVFLVYFAGLLGTKVLISSASINSVFVSKLFEAYKAGRILFNKVFHEDISNSEITTGIFTENFSRINKISEVSELKNFFKTNLNDHFNLVEQQQNYQIHKVVEVIKSDDVFNSYAKRISDSLEELYQEHFTEVNGIRISTGLIRIANINNIVKLGKILLRTSPKNNSTLFHFIIYHSQFLLEKRAKIEYFLDSLLSRQVSDIDFFNKDIIQEVVREKPNIKHHVFIVLASPIAEIGRDHDYDFAIIEPSSYRSIVQIAGRVQRHRHNNVTSPNIHILNMNIKSLLNNGDVSYTNPGFEYKGKKYKKNYELELQNKNIKLCFDNYIKKLTARYAVINLQSPKFGKATDLWTLEFITSSYFLDNTKFINEDIFTSLVGHIPSKYQLRKFNLNIVGYVKLTQENRISFEYFEGQNVKKSIFFNIDNEQLVIGRHVDLVDVDKISVFNNYADLSELKTINLSFYKEENLSQNHLYTFSSVFGFYC